MSGAELNSFGTADGVAYQEVTIRSRGGAEARIITYGAAIRDLVVPSAGGPRHVCLGLNSIADYKAYSSHFGAVPGRFANRIAGGRFSLDGHTYDLPRNDGGINCLHGGPHGFGKSAWTIAAHTENSVTLTLHSPDGDAGFPGAVDVTCVYTLMEPATLRFDLSATTDAPTVINLTNHAYFNLDGSSDILDHVVTINAQSRTPNDAHNIPTGEIVPVAGTPFDFRQPRTVRNDAGQAYDGNYVIAGRQDGVLVHAARVHSGKSGVTLDVFTDQPGIQLYDAKKLSVPVPGIEGAMYGNHAGLCLETQLFPDAPNKPNFPSSVLRPGETYRHATEFRFS